MIWVATAARNGDLGVGYQGEGSLTIRNGVTVNSYAGCIGYCSGSMGIATVAGAGSRWINNYALSIGYFGTGTLNILGGGTVSDCYSSIGGGAGSTDATGAVRVDGAGSTWISSVDMSIGGSTNGMLNISGGGAVTATSVSIYSQSLLAIDVGTR